MNFPRFTHEMFWMGSALLALAVAVCAQTNPQAGKSVIIRAGRVLDVRTGRFLREQDIIVNAEVITAIKPASVAMLRSCPD